MTTSDLNATFEERLEELVGNALVFRAPAGTPALSLDNGRSVTDPRGRSVGTGPWTETDDDPEEVWDDLTDEQRDAVLSILHSEDDKAATAAETEADIRVALAEFRAQAQWNAQKSRKFGSRTLYLDGSKLCVGYVKKGGYRIWLLPVTEEEAVAFALGNATVRYWTNSNRAEVRLAEAA
jgi:hypothetical protein